jgi:pilus assembly protein CpaB
MTMNRKILIVAVVALVAAVGTTAFFYAVLADQIGASRDAGDQVAVVVAATELPRGTQLAIEDLAVKSCPKQEAPEGSFREPQELIDLYLTTSLAAGEPILETNLPATGTGGVAAAIPAGMRAVTIHVEEYAGVTRLLRSGDRVDVLVATRQRRPGDAGMALRTLLQNIEVLSTDRESAGKGPKGEPVATLLVPHEDVEAISLADQAGSIRFALRNPTDDELQITKGLDAKDVMKGGRAAAGPAPPPDSGAAAEASPQPVELKPATRPSERSARTLQAAVDEDAGSAAGAVR